MNRQLLKRAASVFSLVVWLGVIYYLSDQPNSNEVTGEIFGGLNFWIRKASHMAEYAALFWLCCWVKSAFERPDASERRKSPVCLEVALPFLFTFLYALSDEWHQSFVPGRSALFSDVLIDMVGSGSAALLTVIYVAGKRKKA